MTGSQVPAFLAHLISLKFLRAMKNYSTRKLKTVEIKLSPASEKPDLTCNDGEVAEYTNIDWLEALEKDDSKTSASASSKKDIPTFLSLELPHAGVELPHGSRLLAVHSPDALAGECRYLVLTVQDTLAVSTADGSLQYLPGTVGSRFGGINKAVVSGDFIMLVASKGIGWVVFNPSDSTYSLTNGHLSAPDASFSLTPVALSGFCSAPGEWPEIEIAVDIPADSGATQSAFSNWLESGINTAVSEDVRQRVYAAVGEAVGHYARTVTNRGYFLTPPACIAAFADGVLPSKAALAGISASLAYAPPCARLLSWSFQSDILRLKVNFSLLPLALTVNYALPADMPVLGLRFKDITIAVATAPAWAIEDGNSMKATGFTSFIDPSSGNRSGNAFRFNSLSGPEMTALTLANSEFRTIKKISIRQNSAGSETLCHPDALPASEVSPFTPDYRDFTVPAPRDTMATDTGIILFGGSAEIFCREGHCSTESLDSAILSSVPGYPFVFRHYCRVSDGSILSMKMSDLTRNAAESGRHPLHVLSTDGVRRLSADGTGGYVNVRLISSVSPSRDFPIASNTDMLFYATDKDFRSLSRSGTLTKYDISPPDGHHEWMVAGNDNDSLLLYANGLPVLIDLKQEKTFDVDEITLREPVAFESALFTKRSSGTLYRIVITRTEVPDEEPQTQHDVSDNAEIQTFSPDNLQSQADPLDYVDSQSSPGENLEIQLFVATSSTFTTRPLKLGSAHLKKRIRGIVFTHPAISFTLEGSDNLVDWTSLISSQAADNGFTHPGILRLRLPAFRFFRLSAEAPSSVAPHLAAFTLLFET